MEKNQGVLQQMKSEYALVAMQKGEDITLPVVGALLVDPDQQAIVATQIPQDRTLREEVLREILGTTYYESTEVFSWDEGRWGWTIAYYDPLRRPDGSYGVMLRPDWLAFVGRLVIVGWDKERAEITPCPVSVREAEVLIRILHPDAAGHVFGNPEDAEVVYLHYSMRANAPGRR